MVIKGLKGIKRKPINNTYNTTFSKILSCLMPQTTHLNEHLTLCDGKQHSEATALLFCFSGSD